MATTGQVNTNTTYDSFFWVYWHQEGDQDIANNKTRIYWSCGVTCGHSFYSNAIKMSEVWINGTKVYAGGTYSNFAPGEHRIANGHLDIYHDADGKKTFNISAFTGWLYENNNYSAAASSHTLTQIPRGASLTGAVDFNEADNPKITYSNPAGDAVTLEACISLTGAADDIKYRKVTGTSYTFPLTDAERKLLLNNTPGTSRRVHFYLRTTVGGSTFHSSLEKTFTVTENTKPDVWMKAFLAASSIPSPVFNDVYIQGKSRVYVEATAEASTGATISSRYVTIERKTYYSEEFTSDVIQGSGTVTITLSATDSRGFTNSVSKNITVTPYAKPTVEPIDGNKEVLCYRWRDGKKDNTGEVVYVAAKMVYSSFGGKNPCQMEWRRKLATEIWDDDEHKWEGLLGKNDSATAYNNLLQTLEDDGFDTDKAYTIQIRVKDDLGEEGISTFDIPTRDVALHLGIGGKNVSVGSYCDYSEPYTFHSEWKAIFDKEVIIGGQVVANHVVEEGTSGIWTYRKWADGTAECWGTSEPVTVTINAAWGSMYAIDDAIPSYAFPFAFTGTPLLAVTLKRTGGGSCWMYPGGANTTATQTAAICLARPTVANVTAAVDYHAIGRWKE